MSIKAGDVVKLKSGGPKMTVGSKDVKGKTLCHWFVDDNHVTANFHVDALELTR